MQRLSDEEIVGSLIYRDAMILVLNKPSGVAVHKANGGKHNLEQYFHLLQFGLPNPPVLAHRLDLGTSGCLVLARHKEAARRLLKIFSEGLAKKTYLAVVLGEVKEEKGIIDVPLSKLSPEKKHWWMKGDPHGKLKALTHFELVAKKDGFSILKLMPETGRTHQLRVHCAYLGHPILGDYIYGPKTEENLGQKLHLHAHSIELPLYPKKAPLKIEAPLPEHMKKFFI